MPPQFTLMSRSQYADYQKSIGKEANELMSALNRTHPDGSDPYGYNKLDRQQLQEELDKLLDESFKYYTDMDKRTKRLKMDGFNIEVPYDPAQDPYGEDLDDHTWEAENAQKAEFFTQPHVVLEIQKVRQGTKSPRQLAAWAHGWSDDVWVDVSTKDEIAANIAEYNSRMDYILKELYKKSLQSGGGRSYTNRGFQPSRRRHRRRQTAKSSHNHRRTCRRRRKQ